MHISKTIQTCKNYYFKNGIKNGIKTKNPYLVDKGFQKKGDDILSHKIAVPSAQSGLTSLFGMGRGEPRRNNHLKFLVFQVLYLKTATRLLIF